MKPIELTEKHQSKLLEMCSELFPEYNNVKFEPVYHIQKNINDIYVYDTLILYKNYCISGNYKKRTYIHWFEFCMTYLAEKIDCDLAHNVIYMKKHPIDYLYEEFKRLDCEH